MIADYFILKTIVDSKYMNLWAFLGLVLVKSFGSKSFCVNMFYILIEQILHNWSKFRVEN